MGVLAVALGHPAAQWGLSLLEAFAGSRTRLEDKPAVPLALDPTPGKMDFLEDGSGWI